MRIENPNTYSPQRDGNAIDYINAGDQREQGIRAISALAVVITPLYDAFNAKMYEISSDRLVIPRLSLPIERFAYSSVNRLHTFVYRNTPDAQHIFSFPNMRYQADVPNGPQLLSPVGEYNEGWSIALLRAGDAVTSLFLALMNPELQRIQEQYGDLLQQETFHGDIKKICLDAIQSTVAGTSVLSANKEKPYARDPVGLLEAIHTNQLHHNLAFNLPLGALITMVREGLVFNHPLSINNIKPEDISLKEETVNAMKALKRSRMFQLNSSGEIQRRKPKGGRRQLGCPFARENIPNIGGNSDEDSFNDSAIVSLYDVFIPYVDYFYQHRFNIIKRNNWYKKDTIDSLVA